MFQIAQAAMDQLVRSRGRAAAKIARVGETHGKSMPGSVRGDSRAVDAAADDENA
jgi:uncharacterized protein (UPF0210 family)